MATKTSTSALWIQAAGSGGVPRDWSDNRHLVIEGTGVRGNANVPLWLPYRQRQYAYCSGILGNNLSVADAAALHTTDLDVDVECALDLWTAAISGKRPLSKDAGAGAQDWQLDWRLTSYPSLNWWEAGGTARTATATAPIPFGPGERGWLRATLDVDNGEGGHTARFYVSKDGFNWYQLGADVSAGSFTTSIRATASPVLIGGAQATGIYGGRYFRVRMRSTIGGTACLDIDLSNEAKLTPLTTSFTEDSASALTVLVNRSSTGFKLSIVEADKWLFGSSRWWDIADDPTLNFLAADSFNLAALLRAYSAGTNEVILAKRTDAALSAGYYLSRGSSELPRFGIGDGSFGPSDNGPADTDGALQLLSGERHVSNDTLQAFIDENGTGGTGTDTTTGSLTNTGVLRIGAFPGGTASGAFELYGVAVIPTVLTANERTRIKREMQTFIPSFTQGLGAGVLTERVFALGAVTEAVMGPNAITANVLAEDAVTEIVDEIDSRHGSGDYDGMGATAPDECTVYIQVRGNGVWAEDVLVTLENAAPPNVVAGSLLKANRESKRTDSEGIARFVRARGISVRARVPDGGADVTFTVPDAASYNIALEL